MNMLLNNYMVRYNLHSVVCVYTPGVYVQPGMAPCTSCDCTCLPNNDFVYHLVGNTLELHSYNALIFNFTFYTIMFVGVAVFTHCVNSTLVFSDLPMHLDLFMIGCIQQWLL